MVTYTQHIEDLTQEKFSLQRALEAARALSESLAAENSSLTDTYNQQVRFQLMSIVIAHSFFVSNKYRIN